MRKKNKCRIEAYPETRKEIKIMATKAEKNIADFLEELVEKEKEKKNEKKNRGFQFDI